MVESIQLPHYIYGCLWLIGLKIKIHVTVLIHADIYARLPEFAPSLVD